MIKKSYSHITMIKSKILAPKGAKYLSDFMTELPVNCILNKHITGCGATELAIRNPNDTIIAMPYVSLVKNKSIYRRDNISVLGVYGGVSKEDIEEYARQRTPLKIASTYDSIPKVIQALEAIGRNPYKDMFLLVDE